MAESFDPYVQWLGIRDPQRPPNHYRLLGVDPFESDPDVLEHAADRQMSHVRTFQTGRHSAESQRLLNELAAAKVCLLNPAKKAEYDARLRAERQSAERQSAEQGRSGATPKPSAPAEPSAVPPPVPSVPGVPSEQQPPTPPTPDAGPIPHIEPSLAPPPASPAAKRGSSWASTAITVLGSMVLVLAGLVGWVIYRSWSRQQQPGPQQVAARPGSEADAQAETPQTETPEPKAPKPETPEPNAPLPEPPGPPTPQPETPEPETPEPEPHTPEPETPQPATDGRIPLPAQAAQLETISNVRELYKQHYAQAKDRTQKHDLAVMLLNKGQETKDDLTARYVLFTEARDQAIAAGDPQLFTRTVSQIAKEYRVDRLLMITQTLQKSAGRTRDSEANKALAEAVLDRLVPEAVAEDEYDLAAILAEAARDMARDCKPRELELVKRAVAGMRNVESAQQQHLAFLRAEEILKVKPDDPQANVTAGKYYCFVKGDFAAGLPLLRNGNEAVLSGLAEAELAGPAEPAEMVALGDRWYEAAEDYSAEPVQQGLRNRAAYWYEKALPNLSGLTRDIVARRLVELRGG